jgi:hypothetical protein
MGVRAPVAAYGRGDSGIICFAPAGLSSGNCQVILNSPEYDYRKNVNHDDILVVGALGFSLIFHDTAMCMTHDDIRRRGFMVCSGLCACTTRRWKQGNEATSPGRGVYLLCFDCYLKDTYISTHTRQRLRNRPTGVCSRGQGAYACDCTWVHTYAKAHTHTHTQLSVAAVGGTGRHDIVLHHTQTGRYTEQHSHTHTHARCT